MAGKKRYQIYPPNKTGPALRAIGYKDSTYAVAEIIDNAIQAGAKHVEMICEDEIRFVNKRESKALTSIAVLDDGEGMSEDVLQIALSFGESTHSDDYSGIGKFGVGLINSSMSQCRRVEIYTWQKSSKKALWTYIDLDEIKEKSMNDVPIPQIKNIPNTYRKVSKHLSEKSGTLVIWSSIDRCRWKKSETIMKKIEFWTGRIYRKFIHGEKVKIRLCSFLQNKNGKIIDMKDMYLRPNDPMYLMEKSSSPTPYDKKPMFQRDGDRWEEAHMVEHNDKKYKVIVRYSYATNEIRKKYQSGKEDYGKHAKRNQGISIIRSDRELVLDQSLVTEDTRERWWGVEVEFPGELDDVFGLTVDKQSATNFSNVARSIAHEEEDDHDDEYEPLREMIIAIKKRIGTLRSRIKDVRLPPSTIPERPDPPTPQPEPLEPDVVGAPVPERIAAISTELINDGMDKEQAEELASIIVNNKQKYEFTTTSILSGSAFFDISSVRGHTIIKLNENHAAFKNLIEISSDLFKDETSLDKDQLFNRLVRTRLGLQLLIESWARLEEKEHGDSLKKIQNLRFRWGEILDEYLETNKGW